MNEKECLTQLISLIEHFNNGGLDFNATDIVAIKYLLSKNQKYKEVIDKVSSQIKLYGKYNGEKCIRGFSMMTADFNKLLDILKEVE